MIVQRLCSQSLARNRDRRCCVGMCAWRMWGGVGGKSAGQIGHVARWWLQADTAVLLQKLLYFCTNREKPPDAFRV